MVRIVLGVVGVLLALWVVFGLVLPTLIGMFKLLLIVGVIAALVVGVVTVIGKFAK
ncbi:hypothetical protein [Streptosporangium sp. KLBMP 9127]|nr:hypothetical protein [Streptosporangium sp. KLBMP 9127]